MAHTTPEALQYMGQVALNALREIANSDDLLTISNEQETSVYYDILGRIMLSYTFTTYQIINFLALILVPAASAAALTLKTVNGQQPSDILKQKVSLTLQGLVAAVSALVFSVLFIGTAVVAMCKINPSMSYGDVYGAALYTFAAGFLGLQFSQLILPKKLKSNLFNTDASWYGLTAFWWLLVIAAIAAGRVKISGLYFAVWLLAFTSFGLLAHVVIPKEQKMRSAIIYFIQITVPSILLFEIEFLVMDSLRHSTADGTPEIAGKSLIHTRNKPR